MKNLTTVALIELVAELKKRQSRLPVLQQKAAGLRMKLDKVNAEIASLGGDVPAAKGKPGRKPGSKNAAKPGRKPGRPVGSKNVKPGKRAKNSMKLSDAIVAVLPKEGSMSVKEIAQAVRAAGYSSTSKTFDTIIYQTVGKDKRVKRASRGQYTLAG